MTRTEKDCRCNEIISRMNEIEEEKMVLPLFGATDEIMAIDMLDDAYDQDDPDYIWYTPGNPSPEAMETIRQIAAQNCETLEQMEAEQDALRLEYFGLAGAFPYMHESSLQYARNWHEHITDDEEEA